MGIFSKTPSQPPPYALQIHLDPSTPQVLRPNDTVHGHISLTPNIPLSPPAIEVTLYGTSTVWLRTAVGQVGNGPGQVNRRRYLHWRDNAPLFTVCHNLISPGAHFNPGETYTLPFSIVLPAGTGNDRSRSYADAADTRWIAGPHDLPPTFSHGHPRGFDETGPDYAHIEYGVRARVVAPGSGPADAAAAADADVPLFFAPLGRPPHAGSSARVQVHSEAFTLASSALLHDADSGGEAKVGLRQSMRDRFSSKTPKLEFKVLVQVPDELCSGAAFDVGVRVEAGARSEGVRVPRMKVRVEKVVLVDCTFVRAVRDYNASTTLSGTHADLFSSGPPDDDLPPPDAPYSGKQHELFDESKLRLNVVPEIAWLDPEGHASPLPSNTQGADWEAEKDEKKKSGKEKEAEAEASASGSGGDGQAGAMLQHVSFSARIPGTTVPAFRSFAVTRVYRLKVKVMVEACGKEFEVGGESQVGGLYSC